MEELKNLTGIVKRILVENVNARSNNWILFYEVCRFINPDVMNAKFGTVLKNTLEYGLPSFESVTRARRKIVESYPELAGTDEIEGGRWSYQFKFREYAKGCY